MENRIRQGGLVGDTLKRQSKKASRPWVSLTLKGEEVQSEKEKENEEKRKQKDKK